MEEDTPKERVGKEAQRVAMTVADFILMEEHK